MTFGEWLKDKITWRNWTIVVMLVVTVGLLAWDVIAAMHAHGSTISTVLLDSAQQRVTVPFLFGAWMGHMFWFQERRGPDGVFRKLFWRLFWRSG